MMNIVDLSLVRKGREKLALAKMLGENVEYERKCKYILCGKTFMAARKDKDFCCDPHRTASHKLRDNEPSDLAKLMTRAVEFDAQYHGHPSNPAVKAARDAALLDVRAAIEADLGIVEPIAIPKVFSLRQHVEQLLAPVEVPVPVQAVEVPVEAHVEPAPVEVPVPVQAVEAHVEPAPVEAPVEVPVPVQAVEAHVEPAPVVVAPVVAPVEAPVEPLTPEIVRAKLRAFMSETSFGQGKIAKLAGVNQPMISMFLAGKKDGSPSFRQSILDVVDQDHGLDRR